MAFGLLGGVNSVSAAEITKTPILLTGGKSGCNPNADYYFIQMQGWQQFIAYEDATGVAFDEDSYMQFDLVETVSNGEVRVEFFFDDETSIEAWWCLGIGESKDDASIPYGHDFDESKYWLKKGLGGDFDSKKTCKIKKVLIKNFNKKVDDTPILVTYKVNGGTVCGETMTIKNSNAETFGYFGAVFSPTEAQQNIFKFTDFEVGDYQKLVIEFGAATPSGWAIVTADGWPPDLETGITKKEISLNGTNLSEFSIFNWNADPSPINVKEVYLYKDEIGVTPIYEAPTGTTDLNGMTGADAANWTVSYPKEVAPTGEFVVGNLDADSKSVDVDSYDYLQFVVTNVEAGKKLSLRVFVSTASSSDNSTRVTLYPHPIADVADVSNWETIYYITAPGTYAVKISDYPLLRGVKGGNGYWGDESTGSITISQAYLSSGTAPADYVSSGKYTLDGLATGSASLTAALADANATYYDATGITGTGVDLTSVANPNALFKATAGKLSNTNNVIISDVCENLVLADNHPFKAPFDFTATAATYNTTINTTAQAGTLYLPYAAAIPAGVDAWALTYSGGDNVTATKINTGTIPANTPVLLNGSGSKDFTGSSVAIDADATNVSGALTGVFEQGYVPKDSYVLQNKSGVLAFYKVAAENSVTIKPFRAYLTASAGARLYIDFDDEETTGITNNKCETTSNNRYFDLQGREVAQPTTGLYIVNGKKVLVK